MRNLEIIKNSKHFIRISIILIVLSIVSISIFGLKLGTDFTGGSMLIVEFKDIERPSIPDINQVLEEIQIEKAQIQPMEVIRSTARKNWLNILSTPRFSRETQ